MAAATLQLGAGMHTIWLEVSDGHGHASRDSVLGRRGVPMMPLTAAAAGWLRLCGGPC